MNITAASLGWDAGGAAAWAGLSGLVRHMPPLGHLPDVAFLVGLTALLAGIVVWVLYARMKRGIEQRSGLLTPKVTGLIEHVNGVLWEADVRLEGGEWTWRMQLHPSAFCRQLFRGRAQQSGRDLWEDFQIDNREEMDRRFHEAAAEGRPGYEQEFRAVREGRTYWLHENVSVTALGPDCFRLVGLVTDLTAQREAEAARRQSELTVERILAHAQCMIWRATVIEEEGRLNWPHFDVPQSRLSELLFGPAWTHVPDRGFWAGLEIPEQPDMDELSARALREGAPGYDQQFRAINSLGRTFWLHEQVSITKLADHLWSLVGVVTDVTVQHEAEAARQRTETTLAHLLERADCLLWEARVELTPTEVQWEISSSETGFTRRIFGENPPPSRVGLWYRFKVPERPEMDLRAREALEKGQPGYEQQFRLIREDQTFWIHERVTIVPTGPNNFWLVGLATDITVQREAEEARQASELRLEELLSRADCLVWESTVELLPEGWKWGRKIQPSMFYRRLTGGPLPPDTEAMWPPDRVPERAEMDHRCREAIEGGLAGYEQVFRFVKQDGSTAWVSENVTIQRRDEKRYWLVGVAVDITAQRLSEDARKASEQRLQEILARADCLLWEATVELTPTDWKWQFSIQPSLLCQKLYGEAQPSPDQGLWRVFDIPESQRMHERCRTALQEGRPGYDQIFHIIRPDGPVIWISENVTIRPLGANRYSLVGVAVDITAQRGAEEALAAEKERLAVTLRAMNEAVITTDIAGRIQFMNPAAATLIERDSAGCIGRAVQEICVLESIFTGTPVNVPVARVAQGDVVADLPAQTRLVTHRGKRKVVEGCCAPIHAADSKVTGAVLVLRDVTEQERLEQELVRATRLESVGVLAGGIAHDFNNILTAVMGNLALAQLDIPSESPTAASLRSAEKAALRARDLTQQLLTFAKGGEPVRAAIQLEAVVREMAAFALHGSPVKAHYDLAPDLWPADADKGQIGRVVQNLVINAVQAMPRGGTLRIVARNDPHGGVNQPGLALGNYIQIAITDSGEGITAENIARIFDPYFTTKQTGTGLGLAAVYSIIKKHRGHIEVESQSGQGTTFRFWLPALGGQAATEPHTPQAGGPQRPMKGRVLFMDDEQIIREMAVLLFERFGLTVDCAADGAEAVDKFRTELGAGRRYDLVIMDLTVPGSMGGLAALGELKKLDPDVKAVVSSGYSSDPVLAQYRQHGFAAVVAKPYEVGDISRVLREMLPDT